MTDTGTDSAGHEAADSPGPGRGVPASVTLGLFLAWALHDAEELWSYRAWHRDGLPGLPEALRRRTERTTPGDFGRAVGVMAVLVGAAALEGRRTAGRSAVYQGALHAYGVHGLAHLAQAAALRRPTPGAPTSPLFVVSFTWWARGRLRRAGVLRPTGPRDVLVAALSAGATTVLAHGMARRPHRARR